MEHKFNTSLVSGFGPAKMLPDLKFGLSDVLLEQPELLHTLDSGDARQDAD